MFELVSKYEPSGDQPEAIHKLVDGIKNNKKHQVLLGATGTGKTFTIANVIKEINKPTFWCDKKQSEKIINELNNIKNTLDECSSLKNKIESDIELTSLIEDEEVLTILNEDINIIEEKLIKLQNQLMLNGKYDESSAIIEIHPGAGGTESCDWANMLYRMYTRWCEKKNYKTETIEYQEGEVAGLKSATILVKGMYAYGYLKCEKGVHRLVRISPFDSGARRHTSFASVEVTPEVDDNVNIGSFILQFIIIPQRRS